ncbi:MAG: SsrA-binding protein SmpB [Coriobacteriales bacterium]|jgi:SsrA-binding protein|nr:SsrA-binding protein SmpB [Coriobacteriales bacterium]
MAPLTSHPDKSPSKPGAKVSAHAAHAARAGGAGAAKVARQVPKTVAKNRRALHDYFIEETFEAGIALTGTEVRSLREGGGQLTDCFALVRNGELWLHGLHIKPYSHGNRANVEPDRKRKLLMHKKPIRDLAQQTQQAGMALVPLTLYFTAAGLVKAELGLARGKKNYDKRDSMAARDTKREVERALKERSRGGM